MPSRLDAASGLLSRRVSAVAAGSRATGERGRHPGAVTGLLTCCAAKTGEVRLCERLSTASEGYTASPVSDGRHLYFTSELGNVFVVPATATFSVAANNELGETCLSTPALAAGTLFFLTRGRLVP